MLVFTIALLPPLLAWRITSLMIPKAKGICVDQPLPLALRRDPFLQADDLS